jgi:hypothetical protein
MGIAVRVIADATKHSARPILVVRRIGVCIVVLSLLVLLLS